MLRLIFFVSTIFLSATNAATEALANLIGAATPAPDWITYLLNGGPFAVVVGLILLDKLTTTGERDRLRGENETLRQEIKLLNESIRKEIVPPLVQMNELMRDAVGELSERGHYYPPEQKGLRR